MVSYGIASPEKVKILRWKFKCGAPKSESSSFLIHRFSIHQSPIDDNFFSHSKINSRFKIVVIVHCHWINCCIYRFE